MSIIQLMSHGLHAPDLALALVRVAIGGFFAISGFHKLFNPERHAHYTRTLVADHVPAIGFMQWWVAGWEFAAGLLVAVGLFSTFSAGVLMIICVVACMAEAPAKVAKYNPIDKADVVDDYLYLPEVLYLITLAAVALAGPGHFSVDHFLF